MPLDEHAECFPESDRGKVAKNQEDAVREAAKGAPYGSIILRFGVVFGPYMAANVLSDMMQQALLNHDIELFPPAAVHSTFCISQMLCAP